MDSLIDPKRKPAMLEQLRKDADMEMNRASQSTEHQQDTGQRSNIVACADCIACQTRSARC